MKDIKKDILAAHKHASETSDLPLEQQESNQQFVVDRLSPENGTGFIDIYHFDRVVMSRAHLIFSSPKSLTQSNAVDYHGFTIVLSGEGTLEYEHIDEPVVLRAGQVWWRQGHLGKVNVNIDAQHKQQILSLDFEPSLLKRFTTAGAIAQHVTQIGMQKPPCCVPLTNTHQQMLYKAYQLLSLPCAESQLDLMQMEGATLSLLATILQADAQKEAASSKNDAIDIAAMILSTECAQKVTIHRLARRVGLNEFTLKREFKAKYHMTIGDFIKTKRMQLALDLLAAGCDVYRVAAQTGYCNKNYFTKVFTTHFGYPPTDKYHHNSHGIIH